MDVMAKKKLGRPPLPIEEKKEREEGKRSYQAYYDAVLWRRLESFCSSLPYKTEYKEHIEKALDAYLSANGFPPEK